MKRYAALSFALFLLPILGADTSGEAHPPVILVFGDSLTAGFGLEPEQAFPARLQELLGSSGHPHQVVNAGVSGETTAAGSRRVAWILRQKVDIFILALGGNDGLRGIPVEETERNLQRIIDEVTNRSPGTTILLAGMQAPPNMGREFTEAFAGLFPRLAQNNNLPLIPFLLEGVGGDPAFNLPDGIHPNEEGHRRLAANVWETLAELLPHPRKTASSGPF